MIFLFAELISDKLSIFVLLDRKPSGKVNEIPPDTEFEKLARNLSEKQKKILK